MIVFPFRKPPVDVFYSTFNGKRNAFIAQVSLHGRRPHPAKNPQERHVRAYNSANYNYPYNSFSNTSAYAWIISSRFSAFYCKASLLSKICGYFLIRSAVSSAPSSGQSPFFIAGNLRKSRTLIETIIKFIRSMFHR